MSLWNKRSFTPMLLNEINKPFNSKDYIYELKFDGIRAIIFANKNEVKIQSRNQKDITYLYPELQEIKKIVHKNVIFDGEIISLENGKPSFNKLQNRNHLKSKMKIKAESINNPVEFVVFDILYENKDLTNIPLIKRKEILNKYSDLEIFIKSKYIEKEGIKLFEKVKKMSLEGIVAKLKTGTYHINKRTSDFIKIKNIQIENFFVGGYIEKENSNVITLLLGEIKGKKLIYVGKVTMGKKHNLYRKIKNSKLTKNYFENFFDDASFIKPNFKCQIKYLEKTKNNHLRHPVYKGEI